MWGTLLCSPILLLLEGEGGTGSERTNYQVNTSTKSKRRGLILSSLARSNSYAPLLVGTIAVFLTCSCYAIFLRGCGLSKFSFLFGTGDSSISKDDMIYLLDKSTGVKAIDDLAAKSVVHTRTMVVAAKLNGSGIWTSSSLLGPLMHLMGLLATLPSLHSLVMHSWYRKHSAPGNVFFSLFLNLFAIFVGRGITSLVAAAMIGLIGGLLQSTVI